VLLLDGLAPAEIWNRIAAASGLLVPDTAAQREFIDSLLLHHGRPQTVVSDMPRNQ
jgi:hypothetical protein